MNILRIERILRKIKLVPTIEKIKVSITFLSVIVIIIGWSYNQSKNRENEIAKELRGYRLEMLQSIISFQTDFIKNDVMDENLYNLMCIKIKTYGKNDEIQLLNKLNEEIEWLENSKEKLKNSKEKVENNKEELKNSKEEIEKEREKIKKGKNNSLKKERLFSQIEEINSKIEEYNSQIEEINSKNEEYNSQIEKNIHTFLKEALDICRDRIRKELKLEN